MTNDMLKREPLLTEAFFEEDIEFDLEGIAEYESLIANPPEIFKADLARFILYGIRYRILSSKYSRGYAIADIKNDFINAINELEQYKQHPEAEDFFFNGEQDEYMQAITLLALGLLLHVDLDLFRRLVVAIGANGQDYLLDWLVARRLPARRPATTRLLFPKTYARLRDAIQAPPDLQPRLLRAFLAGWYESLDTVWYNIHAHRQDSAGFTGYWCWEAAAVAYCLGLDDAELQAMPYYPADLADYAFGRKPRLSA